MLWWQIWNTWVACFKLSQNFPGKKTSIHYLGKNTAVQLKCHSTLKCIIYMLQSKMQMPTSPCKVSVNFKYDAFCLLFLWSIRRSQYHQKQIKAMIWIWPNGELKYSIPRKIFSNPSRNGTSKECWGRLNMSHSQMLGKFEYGLPAKFWRLVGCTEMLSW